MAGTGVLRNAADAIGIRAYAQRERSCTAVVAGGGLLGLEAAYALHKLGLRTIVLERSDRLLRQLDPRAAQLLRAHLADLGIDVVLSAEVRAAAGGAQLRAVELRSGDRLEAEILLVAAGITPNVGLARACGLAVHRGIVVDERMRTADRRSTRSATPPSTTRRSPGYGPRPSHRPRSRPRTSTGANGPLRRWCLPRR
jgi:NAD(P)H-nitrite reductase large subunit